MDRITPQIVVIVEILVSQHQSMYALTNKLLNTVFDIALGTVVNETAGKSRTRPLWRSSSRSINPPPSLER